MNDKSPSERLRNICEALEQDLNESPFTREEWAVLDADRLELIKANDALRTDNERLTRERDEVWEKFYRMRKELSELKYPGMKGVVHALAGAPDQPSVQRIDLTGPMIRDLYEACGGEFDLAEWTVETREAFNDSESGDPMPAGIYAYMTEYPDEGCIGPLGAARAATPPAPAEECPECFGCGKINMSDGSWRRCDFCDGTGRVAIKSEVTL